MSSNSEQDKDILNVNTGISVNVQDSIKVKSEKKCDVPEEDQISLDEETIFRFSCTVEDDKLLRFRLSEIGALCPFIYENSLSLEEMRKENTAFNATDTLKEVKHHIDKIFKLCKLCKEQKYVWLIPDEDDNDIIIMHIAIQVISLPQLIKIKLMKKMTTEKDDTLIKLYDIQKNGIKIFKEMEEFLKKKGQKEALEKFNELKKANEL